MLMLKTKLLRQVSISLVLTSTVLSACGDVSPLASQVVQPDSATVIEQNHPLAWVLTANASEDAQRAIEQQDLRLLAFAGRALSLPGIDLAIYSLDRLEQNCGYRILKGTGDMLQNENDQALRSKMHDYALSYNQQILIACFGQ